MKKSWAALAAFLIATCCIQRAPAADNIVVPDGAGKAYLRTAGGDLWPVEVIYTTDGSGHVIDIGGGTLVSDNLIVPSNVGIAFLKDASSRLFPAVIGYTTDGNGHVIPIPSGGGGGAVSSVFTRTGAVTAQSGDYSAFYPLRSNNLSDLASASTARTNLGLGTAATHPATDFQTALGFTPVNKAGDVSVGPIAIGTSATPVGAMILDGAGVDDLQSPLVLKNGSNPDAKWFHFIVPSTGLYGLYNPNENTVGFQISATSGNRGFGGRNPFFPMDLNNPDSSTDTTADAVASTASFAVHNTDGDTPGNLEKYVFVNNANAPVAQIVGVNENHAGAGSQSGHVEMHTRLAGVDSMAQSWNNDGTISLTPQDSGVTPSCPDSTSPGTKIALTAAFVLCVCDGSGWVHSSTGLTACTF